ncbi:hypothetical protein TKK_0018946 [Trichogramma kaykai]
MSFLETKLLKCNSSIILQYSTTILSPTNTEITYPAKAIFFCCEDHFNLEEDMKNFIQYKIFGASHLKLKPDVVPHNFACQPERANNSTELNITAFKKLNRKRLLSDILKENNQDSCNIKKPFTNEGSASKLPFSEFSPTEHFQSEFSHSDCADSAQNETALFTVSNAESEKVNNIPNTQSSFDPEQTTRVLRANFSDVYLIIDAFEIRILKPTDPVHQSLTWSEYKKCNTSKYLVAVTCDGMIAYISQGYSGRISDVLLFEKCGITQILPEGCGILADRGYKQIDKILNQFKCKLIRPPSVSSTVKPSKKPHASLDLNIMPNIDYAVTIAYALINLQKPVIRT